MASNSTPSSANDVLGTSTPASTSGNDPKLKHLEDSDLQLVGTCLAVLLMFIFISNISCFYAVYRNIKNFLTYPFFQSNILCMFLSCVDICLATFIGIPGALHLLTANHIAQRAIAHSTGRKVLVSDDGLLNYTVTVAPYLTRYLIFVQLTIVCSISVDRFCNIMFPLKYKFWVAKKKTAIICALCLLLSFILDSVPDIIFSTLSLPNSTDKYLDINCDEFTQLDKNINNGRAFIVPFTCRGNWNMERRHASTFMPTASLIEDIEMIVESVWVGATVVIVIISNTVICVIILRSYRSNIQRKTDDLKKRFSKSMARNLTATLFMVLLVVPAILPSIIMNLKERGEKTDYTGVDGHKVLTLPTLFSFLIIFLPPLLNPCLYPLRMESIRNFIPCLNYVSKRSRSRLGLDLRTRSATMLSSVGSAFSFTRTSSPARGPSAAVPNFVYIASMKGLASPSAASILSVASYGGSDCRSREYRTQGV